MVSGFVEQVLRLLQRSDPNGTEDRKIRFLIRGIKEESFNTIIRDSYSTVSDAVTIIATSNGLRRHEAAIVNRFPS